MEWAKRNYNTQYDRWVPWLEDLYLRLLTRDNKASYATKDALDKTKVTGVSQVDTLQDGVHGLAAGQVGKGGLLQPAGDLASREGVNRYERGGKDHRGGYAPSEAPGVDGLSGAQKSSSSNIKNPASEFASGVVAPIRQGGEGVQGMGQSLLGGK